MKIIGCDFHTRYQQITMPGGTAEVWQASGASVYYQHSDWIGSSRFASTYSRTMYNDLAYAPFGEVYASSGSTDESFAGNNEDTSAALYDAQNREYGIQGRWPSPDPAGMAAASPANPQSWNRYAYVMNNPLAFTDASGLQESGPPLPPCFILSYLCFPSGGGGGGGGCTFAAALSPVYGHSYGTCGGGGGGGGSPNNPPQQAKTPPPACLSGVGPLAPGQSYCAPQTPTQQQQYQQCMSSFNNSTAGKVISPFSVLNIGSNLLEWFGFGGGKVAGVAVLDKAEQSAAVVDYSITTGSVTESAALVGSDILGGGGLLAMAGATSVDATARLGCSEQNPSGLLNLASPIVPVFP